MGEIGFEEVLQQMIIQPETLEMKLSGARGTPTHEVYQYVDLNTGQFDSRFLLVHLHLHVHVVCHCGGVKVPARQLWRIRRQHSGSLACVMVCEVAFKQLLLSTVYHRGQVK